MSNPAVIILDEVNTKKSRFKRFVVEDNIGESIHLHVDNMRVDFTIKEFLEFSKMIRSSLEELDLLSPYSISNFDEHFLNEIALFLPNLKSIKIQEIELSKLKCIVHKKYKSDLILSKLTSISSIPSYKYLQGDEHEFKNYNQYNYFNIQNESRLLNTQASIQKNGYPFEEKYIVLFNGQDIIRDGQHRAAILAHLYGLSYKVKVMRFYFEGDQHLMHVSKTNLKVSLKWFAKKVYSKLKKIAKKIRKRIA